jgi:hypothetical protein
MMMDAVRAEAEVGIEAPDKEAEAQAASVARVN